ncbi:MAG: class I SAM-dependent methyltransferase [Firmicutes bacterium]|nr:class I SAM-dependent methyltransferase [Bacillota bacterium]
MGLFKKFFNMTRKPEGILGKMMINTMNKGHGMMSDWGMSFLDGVEASNICELGCGGGKSAAKLMKRYPEAKLTAVDYSPVSVQKASELNAGEISAGRCTVLQRDVSELDLPQKPFDLATAFETIYFWPGLEKCFGRVCDNLTEGGHFLIVNETDGLDSVGRKWEKKIDGMTVYTKEEITDVLKAAGFSDVKCFTRDKLPWLTVLAEK